jgi:putative DNA primase/helicase
MNRQPPEVCDSATRHTQYTIGRDYVAAGISIIPLRTDGTKSPAVPSWKPYQQRFATDDELLRWFPRPAGIGIVCGVQSGGLEVIDFDERSDETFAAWSEALPSDLFARLSVVETGGLGYHVLYRCDEVSGSAKLAMTAAGGVLVETRGEGGYIVAAGSTSTVHESRRPYVQVRGIPLPDLPNIAPEERRLIWCVAAMFDERTDPIADYVRRRRAELRPAVTTDTSTPWGDFDDRADWLDIIGPHGWTTTNGIVWTRPGKSFGTSAKIATAKDGTEVLTVFSTDAGILSDFTGGHRSWGKFAAYSALNYGGDRSAAAKAVKALGYGGATR